MAEENEVQIVGEGASLPHVVARHADRLKYYVLAAIAVLVIAGVLFDQSRRAGAARAIESGDAVFRTVMTLRGDPDADAAAVFNKVAQDYSGLPGGIQARLLEFAFAYNTRDYAKAEAAAREFLKTYPDNPMAGRARLALGQALLEQDRTAEAITIFRELSAVPGQDIYPEAKFSLAQALEKEAEAARGGETSEYHRRLEAAEAEYTDIVSRARLPIPAQRGHWPQVIVLASDYSLVLIKDKLAGNEPGRPGALRPAVTPGSGIPALDGEAGVDEAAETAREDGDEAGAVEEAAAGDADEE